MKNLLFALFILNSFSSVSSGATDFTPHMKAFLVEVPASFDDGEATSFFMVQNDREDGKVDSFDLCEGQPNQEKCTRFQVMEAPLDRCGPETFIGQSETDEILVSIYNAKTQPECAFTGDPMMWKVEFAGKSRILQGFPTKH